MQSQLATTLVPISEYRSTRQHVFGSPASLEWFLRVHKARLVQHGALLMLTGRWFANPEKFDEYLFIAGRAAAERAREP